MNYFLRVCEAERLFAVIQTGLSPRARGSGFSVGTNAKHDPWLLIGSRRKKERKESPSCSVPPPIVPDKVIQIPEFWELFAYGM